MKDSSGKWTFRKARGTAEFRGTLRYCTPTMHDKQEQVRDEKEGEGHRADVTTSGRSCTC